MGSAWLASPPLGTLQPDFGRRASPRERNRLTTVSVNGAADGHPAMEIAHGAAQGDTSDHRRPPPIPSHHWPGGRRHFWASIAPRQGVFAKVARNRPPRSKSPRPVETKMGSTHKSRRQTPLARPLTPGDATFVRRSHRRQRCGAVNATEIQEATSAGDTVAAITPESEHDR